MSLLIYRHYATDVTIYTDTLTTSMDGKALSFCNKSFLIPHIGFVMATTGILQLADIWHGRLNGPVFADDIDDLDRYATRDLRTIWSGLKRHYGGEMGVTGTIYHFGWSAKHQRYVRYIYRSDKNFVSEFSKEDGDAAKPVPDGGLDTLRQGMENIAEFAELLRAEQLAKPLGQRVYIGGELNMIAMLMKSELGTPVVSQAKVYRFTSYDEDRGIIIGRDSRDRLKNFPQVLDVFTEGNEASDNTYA